MNCCGTENEKIAQTNARATRDVQALFYDWLSSMEKKGVIDGNMAFEEKLKITVFGLQGP